MKTFQVIVAGVIPLNEEEHNNLLGTFATYDLAEQPSGILTYQVDQFNGVLFGDVAATAQARMNGDFDRK